MFDHKGTSHRPKRPNYNLSQQNMNSNFQESRVIDSRHDMFSSRSGHGPKSSHYGSKQRHDNYRSRNEDTFNTGDHGGDMFSSRYREDKPDGLDQKK